MVDITICYTGLTRRERLTYSLTTKSFRELWTQPGLKYLVARDPTAPRIESLVGAENMHILYTGGGKFLASNQPVALNGGR